MDLAKAINPKKKIKFVGIRKGEKIHEELLNASEIQNTINFGSSFKVLPLAEFKNQQIKLNKSYNSFENKPYLSVSELKKLININKKDFLN